MIFLKLLIILFISYNINTAYSFKDPADLSKGYLENAQIMNEVGLSICKLSKERWAGICYIVLNKLKEDDMYKYKVFMNYEAISEFDDIVQWKCIKQEFFFESSLEKAAQSKPLEQEMLPCFARPAFVEPNELYYRYKYYDELMIFPASENSMHVFKRISETKYFYLLETYESIYWSDDNMKVPPELFTLPPPQIIKNLDPAYLRFLIDMDLLEMSSDPENVINRADNELYYLIRTILMTFLMKDHTATYVCSPEDNIRNTSKYSLINHLRIFHPDSREIFLKDIEMYNCPTQKLNDTGEKESKTSNEWKIAAATTPDSVFIMRRVPQNSYKKKSSKATCASGNNCQAKYHTPCRLVALVQNLNPKYILFII